MMIFGTKSPPRLSNLAAPLAGQRFELRRDYPSYFPITNGFVGLKRTLGLVGRGIPVV